MCAALINTLRRDVYHPLARQDSLSLSDACEQVDKWLTAYNRRPAPGPYCHGKSPLQTVQAYLRRRSTAPVVH
jgi:hypothetical protein